MSKSVVITGSARGLGFEMAKQFLAHKYNVSICDVNKDALKKAEAELKKLAPKKGMVIATPCDVTKLEDLEKLWAASAKAFGFGELWRRMGEALGPRLLLGTPARTLDVASRTVNGEIEAGLVVNTAPWPAFERIDGLSPESLAAIASLRHTAVDIDYVPEDPDTPAQWIYQPDPALPEHRWLVRRNFLPGSRGYWRETRRERNPPLRPGAFRATNDWAYPLNTVGKNEAMAALLAEASAHGVLGLGRWGEWQHYNSDLVVERALALAERISRG